MRFSIAVNLVRSDPGESMPRVAREALELVQLAEQGGFEIAWAAEHHGIELTISPNPFLLLIHWAEHTSRIRLGTAVAVAPYWHPLRLAGEAAMTDLLVDGRLELGIARGAFQYEFDRMMPGLSQHHAGPYLFEAVPVLRALWAGDHAHEGEHWRFPKVTSVPKPLQQPHPPLWVAARGQDTFDWGVEHGLNLMTTPLSKPFAEVADLASKLDTSLGRFPDYPRPRLLVLRRTAVFERESHWPEIAEHEYHYARRFAGLFQTDGEVIDGFPRELEDHTSPQDKTERLASIRECMMFGTTEEVVAKLVAYRDVGVDQFCYGADFGLPHRLAMRSLELFIERVMPHFEAAGTDATAGATA